jgi:hypothetical protein
VIDKERRKQHRVRVDWPAVVLGHNGAFSVKLRNISAGGACVIANKMLKRKDMFSLYVAPDNHRPFRADSQVVWLRVNCSQHNSPLCTMGIRFTKVSVLDLQSQESAISNRLREKSTFYLEKYK